MMYVDMYVHNADYHGKTWHYARLMTKRERAFLFTFWCKRCSYIELWLDGRRIGNFYNGKWVG